jgi:PAS domain S-box-containing protein
VAPSSRLSRVALAAAGVLTAFLVLVVVTVPAPAKSILLTDLLQMTLVLLVAFCALTVALRSTGYLRQLWMLFATALLIDAVAGGMETYYQNIPHLPAVTPWPSDVLFFLWVTPAVMMLLPRSADEPEGIDWPQLLDFAQVLVVALTAYLYFFYAPSRWLAEGPQMVDRVLRVQILRDAALAIGFLGAVATSRALPVRLFFTRMAIFFLLASASQLTYFFTLRATAIRANWNDVAWCIPYLFAVVFSAKWKYQSECVTKQVSSPGRTMVASQILPVGIPILVILMGSRLAEKQLTIAWVAVATSFVLSAARLIYTNEKQRRSEKALRVSEQRFRSLIEELHVGVVLLDPNAQIQFVNQAALRMFGLAKNEVLGKKPHDLGLIPVNEEGDEEPWESRPVPRAIRTRQPVRNELVGWKKPSSNETIWITGEILPILRDDGEVDHVVSSFSDVTERKKNEERLHQLSAHLLQLQDEERRRLGRELHDSLAQSVMAVNLDLAQLSRFKASLSEAANRAVSDARETLREMSREIRTLSYLLHPPVLDEMGLAAAVKEYSEGFSARSGIALELDLQPFFKRLPQEAETALFRIVQESLANIQKHSGSSTAVIRLRADSGEVELEVTDRGRGFDRASLEKNGAGPRLGVGILGMRERMAQLGGHLDVESSSSGTTVRAKVRVMIEAQHAPSHLNS